MSSSAQVLHGDALVELAKLADASVDAVVTDPPYGLEFMGKAWDGAAGFRASLGAVIGDPATERGGFQDGNGGNPYSRSRIEYGRGDQASVLFQEWCTAWATECLRVLKPGGHLLAFGGTRMFHRLGCAVEDAGFEIRDSIAWLYGSGFPKSLNVSKAIDAAAGAERPDRVTDAPAGNKVFAPTVTVLHPGTPATEEARRWDGWGTALKPAFEPIIVGRKRLVGGVASNVLAYGTGALNINGCRIPSDDGFEKAWDKPVSTSSANVVLGGLSGPGRKLVDLSGTRPIGGRWPANVVLDEDQAEALDAQSGMTSSRQSGVIQRSGKRQMEGWGLASDSQGFSYPDSGGASRFFYTAKAPRAERVRSGDVSHATVKPLSLMRWLVRLVTPPGGLVLDPFAGSGTTVEACLLEQFSCVAIEREADYLPLIEARIARAAQTPDPLPGMAEWLEQVAAEVSPEPEPELEPSLPGLTEWLAHDA